MFARPSHKAPRGLASPLRRCRAAARRSRTAAAGGGCGDRESAYRVPAAGVVADRPTALPVANPQGTDTNSGVPLPRRNARGEGSPNGLARLRTLIDTLPGAVVCKLVTLSYFGQGERLSGNRPVNLHRDLARTIPTAREKSRQAAGEGAGLTRRPPQRPRQGVRTPTGHRAGVLTVPEGARRSSAGCFAARRSPPTLSASSVTLTPPAPDRSGQGLRPRPPATPPAVGSDDRRPQVGHVVVRSVDQ